MNLIKLFHWLLIRPIVSNISPGTALGIGAGTSLLGGVLGGNAAEKAAKIAAAAGQFSPIDVTTGLGSVTSGEGGVTTQLSPEMLALQEQLFGIGSQGLQDFQTFDPTQAAGLFTQRLTEAAAPLEQQQRQSLENRLFKQGRLGETGGINRLGALDQAQMQAQLQRELAGQQYGTQQQQGLFQNALGAYQAGTELEQLSAGLLPQWAGIGGRQTQGSQFGANLGFQAGQNRADAISGFFNNLGQGLTQFAFQPSDPYGPSGYGSPVTGIDYSASYNP